MSEDFQQKIVKAFGGLGGQEHVGWSLNTHQCLVSSLKEADLDVEDDVEDPHDRVAHEAELLGLEGDEQERPSFQFSKALDRELEEDDYDVMAADTLHNRQNISRPSKHTLAYADEDDDGSEKPRVRVTARRRRWAVPDHVKHPYKYTCYELDEAITVGSGNDGSGAAAPMDMQMADDVEASEVDQDTRQNGAHVLERSGDYAHDAANPAATQQRVVFNPSGKASKHQRTTAMAIAAGTSHHGIDAASVATNATDHIDDADAAVGFAAGEDVGDVDGSALEVAANGVQPESGGRRSRRQYRGRRNATASVSNES